jgi:hypothetical protein
MDNNYITGLSSYIWKRSPRFEPPTLIIQMINIFKNIPLLSRWWVIGMGLQPNTMSAKLIIYLHLDTRLIKFELYGHSSLY